MKKWIIGAVFLFIMTIWFLLSIYMDNQEDKIDGLNQAIRVVQQNTNVEIEDVVRFHGNQRYFVFTVLAQNNERYYIFVNEKDRLKNIAHKHIKHDQQAIQKLALSQYPELKEIITIIPAYSEQEFTWEVKAIDQNNDLQYLYFTMLDGKFQKRYKLGQ